MNEELLKAIFENEGFAKKGISYDQFKIDIKDPSLQEAVFNNSGFSKKGITLDAFRNDLGLSNINNAEFIQITPDTLPTRNNKVFNAPVNKNLVNKLSGFMQNHDLVVTDTNDSKIHKSEAQQLGNSLDVNFNDRDINPIRVKNAIIDAQQRGLNLVYEIKDRRIYDAFIKSNPDLINNVKHIPHATANHFSVYDNDNIATPVESSEPAANLDLTQVINNDAIKLANTRNKEKLDKLPYLKRLAYDWERRSIVSDILDGNGYGMYQATKSEIEAAKLELVQSGKYGKFKNAEELAVVLDPNYKEKINKTVAAADKVQQNLEEDFNTDAGLFDTNPFGDNRGYRIDGRTGQKQANIMPTLWSGDDIGQYWMGVDKLMTLTEHPLITKNPKKYNHREQKELNQHLRDIQADISKPQQIKKEATTGYINNYLQYAQSRATALEKELTSKYGNLEKLSEEAKIKIQQDPLFQEYYEIGDGYAKEFANLENKSANFKLAEANDYLEKTFNKKEDENYKKNYATLGFLEKSLQNVASFTKDAVTGVMHMPGDVGILAGTGIDAIAGTDLGTTRSIASAYNADKISTTAIKEGVIPLSVKLDTEDEIYAIYNDKNEIERFTDGNYFTITDDKNSETFKKLLAEEKKSVNSGKPSWGFNTDAFLHSVREPMVDMVPLILGGGAARTLTTKIASVVGKTSRLGNTLIKAANSDRFLTFAGSFAGFSGKMMDGAIKEGGLVDSGDIFLATTAKVGLEAVIESFNPLGGRLFTDKLFSSLSKQQVKQLSKIISEEGVFKALPIIGRQFRKEILENGLGESMEEILATIIEPSVVNSILNNTIGTTYDTNFSIKDVAESALVGMASGFAMGGILEGGPTALSALNNKSGIINESLRAALQNKQIFDKIIEENKNKELQNASDSDIEKITAKYDTIKKVMDNAASYSEKVFKEHPDTGHVPSSGMQTLYSAVAFDKARKENKKYDLEEDINKNSASIDQDTKKLKELDLFIGAGLDFFNGIADTNKEAKIMSDTELKENYFSVYNEVKNIVAEVGATKNSDKQKLAIIKANTKLALLKAKNKTENKVDPEVITEAEKAVKVEADAAKQEAKELEAKEAVSKGTATPEQVQAELTKAKQSVDDLFTGQKTLKDNELPDFSIDLVQQILENTPDMLKGEIAEYIDKKLEKINAQAYRQQVQNLNAQEKVAKPTKGTKQAPDVAFDTRYGGNTELENAEWSTFKDGYIRELDKEMNVYDSVGDVPEVMNTLDIIKRMESATSFRDAYITDPKFREFVDANTNAIASKPNTLITKDQKQAEADKKAKADAKKQQEISEKQKNIKDIANDPKLYDAAKVIVEKQYASQTFLVKELGITNEKAKELLQELEDNGVIGSHKVGKTRDIYIKSLEDFNNLVQPSAATTKKSASSSDINIVDTSSADIIAQLNKLITAQDKLEWLKQNNLITPIIIDGKSYNAIDYSDRIMVLAKIGKYNIPFYISTGQAGKKNVKAGDWYVVFGIGESGWINKGSEENINSQYDFLIFQKIAKILNEGVGNFNSREDDGNGKIKDFIGYLEDDITSINNFNSQMNLPITPAKNHNDGKTFYKNVNIVLDLVNNELVNITNNKKTNTKPVVTPQQQESINKINKLIEDGKNAVLVEKTTKKESYYTLKDKLYQRVTQFFGSIIFDKTSTVTNLANATVVGNYFDTFGRMYYNNPNITIEEFTAELEKRPDYKQLSKIEVAKLFDDSKQYFLDIKEQIKKDLNDPNLIFITDNIFVHSTFKNGEWDGVAGTLDMVVIDSTGKIHIYDFKTKAENNAKYSVTKESLEDITFGESSQQKWTKQQTAYSRLLKDSFGYTPATNIIVIPVRYETENFTGDYNSSSDIEAFEPTPYNVSFGKTRPFIYKLTFDKNNKLVVALDSVTSVAKSAPLEVKPTLPAQKEKTNVVGGKISINITDAANGFGALSISDNLLVTDYLKVGDPVFYELSDKSTDTKPVIEKVVYYKDKSFGQPVKGAKRIVLQIGFGKDEYKLTERFANEIKAGKERVETKATYVKLNKTQKLTPDNKKQLSVEEIEAIRPYLYVVGKSFNSNENIILLDSEKDGENFVSISDFISDLKDKHPDLKNFQEVENILRHDDVNGKVVFVKGNTIIPLDTITNRDYEPNKKFITEFLDRLSSEATGTPDWRIDIDGRFLADAVRKRSDVKDYTNETSPNFRGRLIEYFASGPQHRQENPTELIYKIKYNEEEGKSEPIYLTKEQALEELLSIRVNIDHAELRAENSEGLTNLLSDVLRVPATPGKGFTILYNVVGLDNIDSEAVTPNIIKLTSEPAVTLKEKETKNVTTAKELKEDAPVKRGGGKKRDFKISNVDYTGKVEEAVKYLKTRFEEIGVEVNDEVLRNLVKGTAAEGSKVWGAFHNTMVTLSSLSGEKIGKHEAIHVAEIMFHTDAQIKAFRQEALSRYGKELGITKTKVDDLTDEELTSIREALATEFEDYKNTLLLPEGFSKKYPTISKFIEKLFNFIKKNYLIGRSYITNKKSIDQLFYEVENNILGRNFIGRRKKSVRDTFQKALDKLSEENKPDFKISDWTNEEVNKFANFLATDIFTNYLNDVYRNNSINEVLANNKNLSLETIIIKFTNSLEKTLDDYKNNVVKREELETSSDEYQILEATLKDIYKQYASNEANKVFKRIVNKKLGNRYAGIVEFDKLEEDSLTENDENIKEVDNTEIAQAESWQTKQGKIDAKTKSSARLREFFSGIPLRTRLIRNGKSERTTITDEDLFSTQYYSGDYIHNKLLLELSDNSNYEDFINAVNNLVKKHQFGADIIAAIMNLKEEKLVEAYDSGTLKLPLDIFTNLEKHSDYKLWILKDMYYAIGDQSNVQPIKTLTTNTGEQTTTVEIGLSVQNTDYDNAVRTIKESIDAILLEPIKKESFKNLLEQTITAINNKGKVAGLIIKVFAEMGYQVSDELLLNLQPTSFINNEEDNLSYLKKGLTSIVNDINDKTKTTIDPTGRGVDIPAKLISTYSTISSGLSYMNVEGENEFAHQNSNHLSRVGAIWAKGKDAMKEWVNNMRYVDGDPNKAIVLQSYLPIYNDMLDSANTFRLYLDGGTQVKGQTNSGKAYADMTFAELTAHSINLYLTKNNQKNAGNTIKKLHALFHVMVFSDSPKRMMLHAPTYNNEVGHNRIIDKLTDIVYGELERVGYAKAQENTSINELEKLSVAGKLIHTIPQLNDVKIKVNGKYMPFTDFFATDLWTNPNSAIQISDTTTYKGISKQGIEFELPLKGGTYRGMVSQIIKETLASDYNHFRDTIYNSDVRKLVTSSATNNDIKDYYYNSYYYNISAGIMFSGDPAHYKLKNDSITTERVKRDKQVVSPNIHLAFEKENYDVIILEDVKANTSNVGNKEVAADLADASAWHTLERRIEILKASPDWELKEAEVLQALEAIQNNKYTQEDLKTVHLQIIKPFVYAQVNKELPVGDGVTAYFKLPIQLKNSEAVLLPTEAYRVYGNNTRYVRPQSLEEITADKYYSPELARTLYLMEKTNVGTVVFESGSKGEIFGKINLETYTEADINAITNPNNPEARAAIVLSLKNSDWGIQQEVPRKDLEAKVGQGTQEHKIMSANVDDNWTFTMENTGEIFKGQQGANDLLQRIQETFVKENYDALLEKITNADGNLNTPEILAIISEALEEKFTNVDTIEGLEIQTDGKTLTPLELFGKKAEKVLNSLFKTISKIKGSGAALVNKTSVGYIRDVEFDKDKGEINLSNDLKLVRDKKGNILYYEAIVPVYNPIIYQFIDNNGELKTEKKIIDGKEVDVPTIPEKLLYSFFYRIPTEDKYSMFPIKIKKFSMPVEGGGIILPREATQTAGLDFDIDKLYGYYYNFKVNYPSDFKTFITNKFNKIIIGDASKYVNALEDATLLLNFTDDELDNFDILKVNLNNYLNQYDRLDNKFLTKTKDFIKLTESSLNNSKSAHNLKLDVYFSLVNTEAYTRDALTPGNKDRLTALRNELVGSHYQPKYSYGDPSFIAKSANKNIVGKRLIGIFANGNSFYNLIQGIAKIMLKNPITFTANGVTYTFDSIGGINHQISKNIAELLFASTEDVKDPVLEPLNINTHTAPLLVTLLSMTNGTEIIKFEDAIKLLSDPSIIDAVREAESEGKKFTNVYPRNGKYYDLVQMSEKYNAIVSASKIDQAIGPDFFTVQSKVSSIDNIIKDSVIETTYPFTLDSVKSILPSRLNKSSIKQLNIFREALNKELELFANVFSFLKDRVISTLDILEGRSKTGKLSPDKKYTLAYYMYDAAIQNLYEEEVVQELTENFPTELFEYKYPGNTGILKQAFEIDKNGIVKMRWVNTNATNILEQYKEAFSDLFTLDPKMAEKLAKYAFLTGTKFKMDSIVKIVPNEFYREGVGKQIRDIINGNTLETYLPDDIADTMMINHYKLILAKEELEFEGTLGLARSTKPYIWNNHKGVDIIYKHLGSGRYEEYHKVEKTKFPNYLINLENNSNFAVINQNIQNNNISENIINYINSIYPNWINENNIISLAAEFMYNSSIGEETPLEQRIFFGKDALETLKNYTENKKPFANSVKIDDVITNIIYNIISGKLAEDGILEKDMYNNIFNFKKQENSNIDNSSVTPDVITDSSNTPQDFKNDLPLDSNKITPCKKIK